MFGLIEAVIAATAGAAASAGLAGDPQLASLYASGLNAAANAYKYSIFPRSDEEKVRRMERHMDWRREQLTIRFWRRVGLVTLVIVGAPLLVAVVAYAWRFAMASVLG